MLGSPQIEHESLLQSALRSGINLFLGAGFSVFAKNNHNELLPAGDAFRDILTNKFSLPDYTRDLSLPQIATILEAKEKEAFSTFLKDTYIVKSFDPKYTSLTKFNISTIFTTNIDNLCNMIYNKSPNRYLNDLILCGPVFGEKNAIDYIPLHGSVLHQAPKYIFGAAELAAAYSADPDRWRYLTRRLQASPTLFWGYSLSDAGTLQALHQASSVQAHGQERWIILRDSDEAAVEYFRA